MRMSALNSIACTGNLTPMDCEHGAADAGAPAAVVAFRPDVQADLDAAGCAVAGCHGGGRIRLVLRPRPASDADWRANYDEVTAHAAHLVEVAGGGLGHAQVLEPGGLTAQRWRAWIAGGTRFELASAGDGPARPAPDAGVPAGGDAGVGAGALTWDRDVGPLLAAAGCTRCHGQAGSYALATYRDALGPGADTVPNVIPGDSRSILLQYAEAGHGSLARADAVRVRRWIVEFGATEHEPGGN